MKKGHNNTTQTRKVGFAGTKLPKRKEGTLAGAGTGAGTGKSEGRNHLCSKQVEPEDTPVRAQEITGKEEGDTMNTSFMLPTTEELSTKLEEVGLTSASTYPVKEEEEVETAFSPASSHDDDSGLTSVKQFQSLNNRYPLGELELTSFPSFDRPFKSLPRPLLNISLDQEREGGGGGDHQLSSASPSTSPLPLQYYRFGVYTSFASETVSMNGRTFYQLNVSKAIISTPLDTRLLLKRFSEIEKLYTSLCQCNPTFKATCPPFPVKDFLHVLGLKSQDRISSLDLVLQHCCCADLGEEGWKVYNAFLEIQ